VDETHRRRGFQGGIASVLSRAVSLRQLSYLYMFMRKIIS